MMDALEPSRRHRAGRDAGRNRAHGWNGPRYVLRPPLVTANADLAICCEATCLRVRKVTA
jgi:hypothetical protein